MKTLSLILLCAFTCATASAQMTVVMVPSADVMEKGKVYFRADTMYRPVPPDFQSSANFMVGLGHGLEFDLNGVNVSDLGEQMNVVAGFKYSQHAWLLPRFDKGGRWFVGDQVWNPVYQKGHPHGDDYHAVSKYSHGNFLYAGVSQEFGGMPMNTMDKMWKARVTLGVWNSQWVQARGNRTGVFAGFEYNATTWHGLMLMPAVDWSSGKDGIGYITPGLMLTYKKFMIQPGYMIGNNDVTRGNHMAQLMIGYTF